MFRMKNIEIMLNLDDMAEIDVVSRLRTLVRRAQIFLVVFSIDLLLFLFVTALEIYKYVTSQYKQVTQEVMWRVIYISYAVFLLIWFCYYVFLSLYFRKMLLIYSQCIL